jgi:hypothetical protein
MATKAEAAVTTQAGPTAQTETGLCTEAKPAVATEAKAAVATKAADSTQTEAGLTAKATTKTKAGANLSDETEACVNTPAQTKARLTKTTTKTTTKTKAQAGTDLNTKTSAETAAERPAESPTRPARTKTGPARTVSRPERSETRPEPTETRPEAEPRNAGIQQSAVDCTDQVSPQPAGNRAGVVHHSAGGIRNRVTGVAPVVVPTPVVVARVISRGVISGCKAVLVGHRLLQTADRVASTEIETRHRIGRRHRELVGSHVDQTVIGHGLLRAVYEGLGRV